MADGLSFAVKQKVAGLLSNPTLRALLKDNHYHTDSGPMGMPLDVWLSSKFTFTVSFEGDDLVLDIQGERKELPQVVVHALGIFGLKGRITQIKIKKDGLYAVIDGLGGERKLAEFE